MNNDKKGGVRLLTGAWKHFRTITYHKYLVMKGCFAVGLYRQGLTHDLSKYSPAEFLVGAKYFQGNRSPNNAEREEKGYSSAGIIMNTGSITAQEMCREDWLRWRCR